MAPFKILITDNLAPEGIAILEKEDDIAVDLKIGIAPDELRACIGNYDAIITRSGTSITADLLANPGRLKIIGRAGVGLDNIDLEAASIKGIIVMNAPTGNTIAATELTMGMMLAAARKIPAANSSLKRSEWDRKRFMGRQLYGKTLGIIGLGRIGGSVAARAKAFGMKVIAYDPYIKKSRADGLGVTLCEQLEELLTHSDFITVHTPKTGETIDLITAREFALMKDGVVVVNCARGGIINEDDLCDAVRGGKVFAAAVDVFGNEPLRQHPLLELDNVFVTPHIGANTFEGQEGVAVIIARQVINALRGKAYENAVNIPYMRSQLPEEMQLYFDLAESMGRLLAQIARGRPEVVELLMVGPKFKEDFGERVFDIPFSFQPFTVAGLKGFLERNLQETVSFINAPYLAKERDIKVQEAKISSYERYNDLFLLRIRTDAEEHLVGGTVFADRVPRVLFVDQFHLEMIASGRYLYFKNIDKPGIVGRVGTVLGRHQINIAGFNLSRIKGGKAVSFVSLDNEVPEAVLQELVALDGLLEAKIVSL
ncbi:MAG: phosphoglycerate dehydrogenase [Deltaproteobacteria bacterium]|nr:phosphoglycerate dehydrogenase [Deltaproteobacteria bacterium]